MKLSRSSVRSAVIVPVLATVLLLVAAAPAFASLDDPPGLFETFSNPNVTPDEWRESWGNKLDISFKFSTPPYDVVDDSTKGFIYRVGRTPIEPVSGDATLAVSWDKAGAMMENSIDVDSVYREMSDVERLYTPPAGQTLGDPREGPWYVSVRFFNEARVASTWWPVPFYIDLTPPRPIEGFTSGVTMPTETTRRTFTWLQRTPYDTLSGDARYLLFIDDLAKPLVFDPLRPGIPVIGWLPGKATFENIKPGKHTFGIQVMDKATNVSSMITRTEIVDPAYPTVGIDYPGDGTIVSGVRSFTASATDDAGLQYVDLRIDGVSKSRLTTSAPFTVDTRKMSDGKHTFTAEAKDLFGHVRTVTRTFYVDNTKPAISSLSDSPDPFYPVKQDGYKDTTSIRAYLAERTTDVFLQILDGSSVVRQIQYKNLGPGWATLSWDGRNEGKEILTPGDFPAYKVYNYRIIAKDAGDNWSFSAFGTTEIRNFEILPLGGGKVKVVER